MRKPLTKRRPLMHWVRCTALLQVLMIVGSLLGVAWHGCQEACCGESESGFAGCLLEPVHADSDHHHQCSGLTCCFGGKVLLSHFAGATPEIAMDSLPCQPAREPIRLVIHEFFRPPISC